MPRTHIGTRTAAAGADPEHLLSAVEAAKYTPYSPRTMANLRSAGKGPAFINMPGGAIAYRLRDLLAWQAEHRVSTVDQQRARARTTAGRPGR